MYSDVVVCVLIVVFPTCSLPDQPLVQFCQDPDSLVSNFLRAKSHSARDTVFGCSISKFAMMDPPLIRIRYDCVRVLLSAKFFRHQSSQPACGGRTGDQKRHCCDTCGTHFISLY
jgi:hypothetical protein